MFDKSYLHYLSLDFENISTTGKIGFDKDKVYKIPVEFLLGKESV